ncbi:MAG: AIPR family protein [Phycisphaeraceae bacterium]|nr:AIPR family protein [Phycisphaeraceae bacterium]
MPPPANIQEIHMAGATAHRPVPVEFLVHVDDFRSHRIPGLSNSKVGSCFIRADELVKHLDLDEWLAVNPRVPTRSAKDVLTGHVVRGIQDTLREAPADFALKNQGLYLLVQSVGEYERQRDGGRLRFTMSDPLAHGLCNGGHTYAAVREYSERAENPQTLEEVWIRLHLFEGIDPDKVPAMAEGLNRSRQVDDPSLMNLEGQFEAIRKTLQGKPGHKEIAYRQGDPGNYYITEIIRAIMFFNCQRFDSRKHPSTLYRQQKQMLDAFRDDAGLRPSPIALVVPHIHEILVLMDMIAQATPAACKRLKPAFELGRMKGERAGVRAGSAAHKDTPLFFLGTKMDHKIHTGWLLVMLAAFRANVRWDLASGVFEWKTPLAELLPKVVDGLVAICVQEYRDNKSKPDEMARNPAVYDRCYKELELELLRSGIR